MIIVLSQFLHEFFELVSTDPKVDSAVPWCLGRTTQRFRMVVGIDQPTEEPRPTASDSQTFVPHAPAMLPFPHVQRYLGLGHRSRATRPRLRTMGLSLIHQNWQTRGQAVLGTHANQAFPALRERKPTSQTPANLRDCEGYSRARIVLEKNGALRQ